MNEIEQKLADLKTQLEGTMDAKVKAQLQAEIATLKAQLDQIATLKAENETLKSDISKLKTDAAANQPIIDEMVANKNKPPQPAAQTSMKGALGAALNEKAAMLKAYKDGQGKGFSVEMKVVGDMSSANTVGSYFVTPTIVPGITLQPYEEVHLRNILPTGTTNSNVIRYVRDMGGEGGPTTVAAGAEKPQIDRDLEIFDAPVRKIAVWFRVPEEMIDDIPYLQSFLTQIGLDEVMAFEDQQILYGNGVGQNLSGLFTNATAFSGAGTDTVEAPNEFDVIRAARRQLRNAKLGGPLVALVSPDSFFDMTSRKDTTENYLFLGGGNGIALANPNASPTGINIGGVMIEEHTAISDDDFLVFQPRSAAIFDRTGTTVRFYDQDRDNAIKNLITVVIEKRLALPIYRPAGFIEGDFDSAIADLASGS
jgi:HK97 family phage major capsid protein